MSDAPAESARLQEIIDATMKARNELQRRLDEILMIAEDYEDITSGGNCNDWMKIAQIARGEDRP